MLSLIIQHYIHLTREQRYDLYGSKDVQTVGISVPVWLINKVTSEPAKEVFCKYTIKNPMKDVPIMINPDGYDICLPYREGTNLDISNKEWRHLNKNNPAKLQALYQMTVNEMSAKNLLDIKDGGAAYMDYREHNKFKYKGNWLNIIHHVCINTIENLENSLTLG